MSSQIYKKYNWQHVNDKLAIRTTCEKGRRTGPRALQHVRIKLRIAGAANIILADFNLVVSTLTAKPPNFLAIRY